jgi:hypothetical protein
MDQHNQPGLGEPVAPCGEKAKMCGCAGEPFLLLDGKIMEGKIIGAAN